MTRTGVESFVEHDLLSYASAIAFQVLFALVPLALAAVALLGFLDLEEIWRADIRPEVRERLEPDSFTVVDRTVEEILGARRGLWLTFGLAFALWQVSGAVRATMGPLNSVYHESEGRPWWKRFLVSFALAPAISLCILLALLSIHFAPQLVDDVGLPGRVFLFLARWSFAVVLLLLAVWLLLRFAPAKAHSFRWAGFGAIVVVTLWILASLAFGWYATTIADYGSVFGSLASVIVLMTYLYLSAGAFLVGVQADACVRAASDYEEGSEGEDGPAR